MNEALKLNLPEPEVVFTTATLLLLAKRAKCPVCHGLGYLDDEGEVPCTAACCEPPTLEVV